MRLRSINVVSIVVLLMVGCAPFAFGSAAHPTVPEVASMVTCPSCTATVNTDRSPAAGRMRAYIREKVAAGWTRRQVLDGLVAQYGGDRSIILATRDAGRRSTLVWGIPVVVLVVLSGLGIVTVRRWSASAAAAAEDARSAGEEDA